MLHRFWQRILALRAFRSPFFWAVFVAFLLQALYYRHFLIVDLFDKKERLLGFDYRTEGFWSLARFSFYDIILAICMAAFLYLPLALLEKRIEKPRLRIVLQGNLLGLVLIFFSIMYITHHNLIFSFQSALTFSDLFLGAATFSFSDLSNFIALKDLLFFPFVFLVSAGVFLYLEEIKQGLIQTIAAMLVLLLLLNGFFVFFRSNPVSSELVNNGIVFAIKDAILGLSASKNLVIEDPPLTDDFELQMKSLRLIDKSFVRDVTPKKF